MILTDGPISKGAYRLLKQLKQYDFQKKGWACPRQKTLADDLKVTTRQIQRYVAELEKANVVYARRRPNSSCAYHFVRPMRQNVGTVPTGNVAADVAADVGTFSIILKALPNAESSAPPIPSANLAKVADNISPESKPKGPRVMQRPAYYQTPEEIKLWNFAQRWMCANPGVTVSGNDIGRLMRALEDAGALQIDDIPTLTDERFMLKPQRKPAASQTMELLRRAIG